MLDYQASHASNKRIVIKMEIFSKKWLDVVFVLLFRFLAILADFFMTK